MTQPVTYVELNSPDLEATAAFTREIFGWEPQPFATPDYLVAPHGDGPGVDTGILASRDGNPRTVPIVRVDSIADLRERVESFTIPGIGRGCYLTDPPAPPWTPRVRPHRAH